MKYKYGVRRRASEYEKALVEHWKKNKTFEKSDAFVFHRERRRATFLDHERQAC